MSKKSWAIILGCMGALWIPFPLVADYFPIGTGWMLLLYVVIGLSILCLGAYCSLSTELQTVYRSEHGLCLNCGYDLRATPYQCPECGKMVKP